MFHLDKVLGYMRRDEEENHSEKEGKLRCKIPLHKNHHPYNTANQNNSQKHTNIEKGDFVIEHRRLKIKIVKEGDIS